MTGGRGGRSGRCVLPQHGPALVGRCSWWGGAPGAELARPGAAAAIRDSAVRVVRRTVSAWPRCAIRLRQSSPPGGRDAPGPSAPWPDAARVVLAGCSCLAAYAKLYPGLPVARLAVDHAVAQRDVRAAGDQIRCELLQLVALRLGRRGLQVRELGPDQDQVVALVLGLDNARPLAQVLRRPGRAVQRVTKSVDPDAFRPWRHRWRWTGSPRRWCHHGLIAGDVAGPDHLSAAVHLSRVLQLRAEQALVAVGVSPVGGSDEGAAVDQELRGYSSATVSGAVSVAGW